MQYFITPHAITQFRARIKNKSEQAARDFILAILPAPESVGYEQYETKTIYGKITLIIKQSLENPELLIVATCYKETQANSICGVCNRKFNKQHRPTVRFNSHSFCSSKCEYSFRQSRHGKYKRWK